MTAARQEEIRSFMTSKGALCVEFRPHSIFVFFPTQLEHRANVCANMLRKAGAESCCTLIEQSGEYMVSGIA